MCAGLKLESEFPVQDLKSGQGGLLQVCMEGIGLLFANTKVWRRWQHSHRVKYIQLGSSSYYYSQLWCYDTVTWSPWVSEKADFSTETLH